MPCDKNFTVIKEIDFVLHKEREEKCFLHFPLFFFFFFFILFEKFPVKKCKKKYRKKADIVETNPSEKLTVYYSP